MKTKEPKSPYPKGVVEISVNAIDWHPVETPVKRRVRYCKRADGSYIRCKMDHAGTLATSFTPVTSKHIEHMAELRVFEGGAA